MLYRTKLTWQNFGDKLSALARELTQRAMILGEELAALNQLNKTWQGTLQSAKRPDTPPPVLQSVQGVVDSSERTRQAVESCRAEVLNLAKPPFREGNPGANSSVFSGAVTNPGIEKSSGKR